jgi:hypothetical protein
MKTLPFLLPLIFSVSALAQTSLLGTVGTIQAPVSIEVKPDTGAAVQVKLSAELVTQRIAPGSTDLKTAHTIALADVATGDRVLVTLDATRTEARRIIVMSANDIAKRNAADRQDWTRRGVSGVVSSKTDGQMLLKSRTLSGEVQSKVNVTAKTVFKRYAPDSVKFTDAKVSSLAEVASGDQMRARGVKSADGLTVDADEVVFGTFLSLAGSITAVNAAGNEITIKDLTNKKNVIVRFTPDSQVKRMTTSSAAPPNPTAARPPAGAPGASPAPGAPAGPPSGGRGGGGDIAQMVEAMPQAKLEELKPGDTIVVSATKGERADQITAILLLANADMLVQLAAGRGARGGGPPPSLGGLASSISGIGP